VPGPVLGAVAMKRLEVSEARFAADVSRRDPGSGIRDPTVPKSIRRSE
jgi:hypothetical protein